MATVTNFFLRFASSGREELLSSSRAYYARRASYCDPLAHRRGRDRETPRELELLEFAFRTHATRQVREVLDIACTGYDFTPELIEAARARAARQEFRSSSEAETLRRSTLMTRLTRCSDCTYFGTRNRLDSLPTGTSITT